MSERARRRVIGGVVVLVIVIGLAAEALAHGTRIDFAAQRDLLTGWTVAACGIVGWAAVPHSRIGPLLALTGLSWFTWNAGSVADIRSLVDALTNLCAGFLAHALFTWPTGRAQRPLDSALVAGGYVVAVFPPLWERDGSLAIVAGLLAIALLAQHVSLPRPARRLRRPVLVLGLSLAVVLAVKGAAAAALRAADVAYPSLAGDLWQIAVVVVAVGLTWGLLALERRRRGATDLVIRLGEERPSLSLVELADAAGIADDVAIAEALAVAREMAARNAVLREELEARVAALERSRRRIVEAGDEERTALEERLRRGPAERLARLERTLGGQRERVATVTAEGASRLDRALDQLGRARTELSELASGLDPSVLREQGLEAALRDLAQRSPVPATARVRVDARPAPSVTRTLFYVASEAFANVAKHAGASQVWLRLVVSPEVSQLTVEDDGVGTGDGRLGSGLRGMRDRLEALGGSLHVSARDQRGTRLTASIPSHPASADRQDATA